MEKNKKKKLTGLVIFFVLIIIFFWALLFRFEIAGIGQKSKNLINLNIGQYQNEFDNLINNFKTQYEKLTSETSTPLTNEQLELLKERIKSEISTSTNSNINLNLNSNQSVNLNK